MNVFVIHQCSSFSMNYWEVLEIHGHGKERTVTLGNRLCGGVVQRIKTAAGHARGRRFESPVAPARTQNFCAALVRQVKRRFVAIQEAKVWMRAPSHSFSNCAHLFPAVHLPQRVIERLGSNVHRRFSGHHASGGERREFTVVRVNHFAIGGHSQTAFRRALLLSLELEARKSDSKGAAPSHG